ncbi:S9 family peptidase [Thalassotalea mangrovi]|uniref:S9 family peptidase n=1 Tax=Thalassotalea mangrovi TaxID=2572245 RepID=A0A4U1B5R6_9GAMM|nr:prolyl oligopeptidase family serine peptidase [Thalassotalea mangrovi]TKB45650.1 S9 family peptidase [Thalassotalea mangrovi]
MTKVNRFSIRHTALVASIVLGLQACASSQTNTAGASQVENVELTPIVQADNSQLAGNSNVITMEKIMSDPDWIARTPTNWYWGDNSDQVMYLQKRQGNPVRDLYIHGLDDRQGQVVGLAELHKYADSNAIVSKDGNKELYTFEGNVFLKDLQKASIQQLTFTTDKESSVQFLSDDRIAYRSGNSFYALDLNSFQVVELANLQMTDTPKSGDDSSSYLAQEQNKLIDYVALQQRNKALQNQKNNDLRAENDTINKAVFYFGKDKRIVQAKLSPDARYLVVSTSDDENWRSESDIMPNYITDDGNIASVPARRRVADNRQYSEQLYLLDLQYNAQYLLGYDTLDGFEDDVLADVRKENYAREGKTYESKKSPRNIHLMSFSDSIKWHPDGSQVAVMMEAWDNKDRWIATIDFEEKQLVNQHRLHDDAWINWEFNEFGWLQDSASLYYLSEESGYSHLYVKPVDGKATALTSGKYEVRDVTVGKNQDSFYFQANVKHPGIYEIYRVGRNGGDIEALTDLGGMNQYALSPDQSKLLVEHSTTTMPPELYIKELGSQEKARQLTFTVSDEFKAMPWVAPSIVEVPSKHSKQGVFSRVYQGDALDGQGGENKAVMFVHGAGYLQNSHLGWSGYFREFMFHSMLVQQGYTVIDMDYRASKGYGRDWRTAIYRHMGEPEVQDMLSGVDWLVENAGVDRNKVGVYGGSYGGFLTLMAMFKEPEVFASGSALRLVSDWAYYNHGYTSNILNMPGDDAIAYERSSPIYFAEGLEKPLLINAPMIDDNVFFQDTVRLVQRLIELEKEDFETAIYPVEPHGFVQPSSWLNEYRRIFKLFEETL